MSDESGQSSGESLQPFLHNLLVTTMAPTQVWSGPDAQIRATGAQGVFQGDVRVLSEAVLTVDGVEPEALRSGHRGAGVSEAFLALRMIDGPGADPTVWVRRRREVSPGHVHAPLVLECATEVPVSGTVRLRMSSDLADLESVKQGRSPGPVRPEPAPDGVRWTNGEATSRVVVPGARLELDDDGATAVWEVTVHPRAPLTLGWDVYAELSHPVVTRPVNPTPEWRRPVVQADDPRLHHLVERSLDDLETLRMTWVESPQDVFLAAGSPWFFTLFGRDSLWAARFLLPLGTDLARGTLRTLAAAQGTRSNPVTQEQPGKILHEVRSKTLHLDDGTTLPPVYYGTVDATPLWVCLLTDAWRWGLPDDDVRALLPAMERCLEWMLRHADSDGDGFLDYQDPTGHGLANQGWKDSGDSIQWRDGRLAEGPIALSEVQAYAYEAAMGAADLLDHFGRPGGDGWRTWAGELAHRFRNHFWTRDAKGPYPGIARDRYGAVVDSVSSNMGHLLGTGLLRPDEERAIARRLVAADMSSGYGLRTLSTTSAGYWPLKYHGGSVWAHDTAIAIHGMARAGLHGEATPLVEGLLEGADHFGYQLPELYGGNPVGDGPGPVPYPASCHPQAWSAASAVVVLTSLLAVQPDRDVDTLVMCPPVPVMPVGSLRVEGVQALGRSWTVERLRDGTVRATPR
ncbi:glycogen debranching N-terminal domain-containing protein [Antribacter gilvus]|uniref:amylo-alpha-1,6-glucosidase n=1 Tax=Antribacter gilvus TaxID=2304675 RepID=UPI001F0C747F|nr:glycogen debranching N-terminal domain-containing protein [Antribacter gilvus]